MRVTLAIASISILVAAMLVPAAHISAQTPVIEVQLTVDMTELTLQDTLSVKVRVTGTKEDLSPELVNVGSFAIETGGSSSQIQIINGKMSVEKSYNYLLYPRNLGPATIGPAVVEVDGKAYQSKTVQVRVVKDAGTKPTNNLYVDVGVSDERPFVNQQVVYTFRFFNRVQVANGSLELPQFDGFWKEEMRKQREYERVIDGKRYSVSEFKVALFPQRPGKQVIPEAQLRCDVFERDPKQRQSRDPFFDNFFGRSRGRSRRVNLRSKPVNLTVRPLPTKGKPADFSGLVGSFVLQGSLSKSALAVGESATLTVMIAGDGNVRDIQAPLIPSLSAYKVYDDNPTLDVGVVDDRIFGKKTFKKALVPQQPGSFALKDIRMSYFNPVSKAYEVASIAPIPLQVSPADQQETIGESGHTPTARGQGVKVLGKDLMPIHTTSTALQDHRVRTVNLVLYWILLLLPAIGFLVLIIWQKRLEKISKDGGFFKRKHALAQAKMSISALNKEDVAACYEQGALILRRYLSDRFGIDGQAVTPLDVERVLGSAATSNDLNRVRTLLQRSEEVQFGGARLASQEGGAYVRELADLLDSLEKQSLKKNSIVTMAAIVGVASLVIGGGSLRAKEAEGLAQQFHRANEAHLAGKYQEAIDQYRKLLTQDYQAAHVYYNLGNSSYRLGNIGWAIYYYRIANQGIPRDPDLRFNLNFARSQRQDKIESKSSFFVAQLWTQWLQSLNKREAWLLLVVAAFLFWLLWGLRIKVSRWGQPLKLPHWSFGVLAIVFAATVFDKAMQAHGFGVVISSQAAVASGVGKDRVVLFNLKEGSEVELLEQREQGSTAWFKIELPDGKKGWIKAENLAVWPPLTAPPA